MWWNCVPQCPVSAQDIIVIILKLTLSVLIVSESTMHSLSAECHVCFSRSQTDWYYWCRFWLLFNWPIFKRSLQILAMSPEGLPERILWGLLVQDFFAGSMAFLSPSHEHQSTEGRSYHMMLKASVLVQTGWRDGIFCYILYVRNVLCLSVCLVPAAAMLFLHFLATCINTHFKPLPYCFQCGSVA